MDENGEMKKGPWKAEEDQVLIEHVSRNGARDWSSIRSKGLLLRTGKSCRLRWVNKLRPNLKSGVKFSAEEERAVIDLQAKFGNKWAKISTYLQGRTDNDVKNFWSSRKKRLQRIQQTFVPKSNRSHKRNGQITSLHDVSRLEAPKLSTSTKADSVATSSLSSSYCNQATIANTEEVLKFEQKSLPLSFCPISTSIKSESSFISPQIPQFEPDLEMLLDSQEFIPSLGDSSFVDVFRQTTSELLTDLQRPNASLSSVPQTGSRGAGYEEIDEPHAPDSFIDDLPLDMFDQIESLPSPSHW